MGRGTRRFSEAISEGDGISLIVDVRDADGARVAAEQGAEALALDQAAPGLREATELPILWRGDAVAEAIAAGADALLLVLDRYDDERLEELHAEAVDNGLDCVVEVRTDEELEAALERLDPEIFLLAARGDAEDEPPLEWALELLQDVPAGKLAVAEAPVSSRHEIAELERAGVDAVLVGARNVAELIGDAPPEV